MLLVWHVFQIEVLELDLSSMKSVKTFVNNFKQRENHLNILINNAGKYVTAVILGYVADDIKT